jgi:membrane-associated phospholipid phosphatase
VSHRTTTLVAAGAAGALVWSASVARRNVVSEREAHCFRVLNGAPGDLAPMSWLVMQAGSLGAVPIAAALAGRSQGTRAAVIVGVAGSAVWGGVKAVKPIVGRGRPSRYLDDVTVRGSAQSGLGYPSGHAAVATSLGMAVAERPVTRAAGAAVALAVGAARMRTGAHLPLDVVGGTAIGVLAGLVTRRRLRSVR